MRFTKINSFILFIIFSNLEQLVGCTKNVNRYGQNEVDKREPEGPTTFFELFSDMCTGVWDLGQRVSVLNYLLLILIIILFLGLVGAFGYFVSFVVSLTVSSPVISTIVGTVVGIFIIILTCGCLKGLEDRL